MGHKKVSAGRPSGSGTMASGLQKASVNDRNNSTEQELSEVDREIIGALTDFRDTLRARTPLESKYTVRHVMVVVPPPQIGPEDVKRTREALGLSQPVFADFLGTSLSTIRSWEQGQKPPSPMARRLLGLIATDPTYWKSQFCSMAETRGAEQKASSATVAPSGTSNKRKSGVARRGPNDVFAKKAVKKKSDPKVTT
jgi:putative transcriptional regulator